MIQVTDLRAGKTFQVNGVPFVVTKYAHTKMGRGGATIRIGMRNLKNGSVEEKTFNSGATVESTSTTKRRHQYLYSDGSSAVFMDARSFEQVEIPRDIVGKEINYLREGQEVDILFWSQRDSGDGEEKALGIDLPPNVNLTVSECDPGLKGNSATNVFKPAKLENGISVKVPLFIKIGDKVKIDTRTGEYVERVAS